MTFQIYWASGSRSLMLRAGAIILCEQPPGNYIFAPGKISMFQQKYSYLKCSGKLFRSASVLDPEND